MRIIAKMLIDTGGNPFDTILCLRATVEADYENKIFYVRGEQGQNSWGIHFAMKDGYTAEKPDVSGLSSGTKDGVVYWVSAKSRPATHDYFFSVVKGDKVTDTYRVVYII